MDESKAKKTFLRFKKASTLGYLIILTWVGIVGGSMMIQTGSSIGWWGITFGVIMLLIPFTPLYRTFLHGGEDQKVFPISVFISNVLLILLYGYLAKDFLLDPDVLKNEMNKSSLILWTGAILLSIASLVVNIIVFRLDRDSPNKTQTG